MYGKYLTMYGFGVDNVKNQQAKHRWLSRKRKSEEKEEAKEEENFSEIR